MSVLLELGEIGDLVIDLFTEECPKTCENFLKLCKIKYYNFSPISNIQPSFTLQTGDPIGPFSPDSDGGSSIWGLLPSSSSRLFPSEFHPSLKHSTRGTVSMATTTSPSRPDQRYSASQFIITLGENIDYLDGKASVFGKVVEGFDTLERINEAMCDEKHRPLKDIRIRHTIVLEDPFPDPPGLVEPPESPLPTKAQLATVRIDENENLGEDEDEETKERRRREQEAKAQALTLEMVGDLPFADVKPPENVLFVCKLNPVTGDDDLYTIFSRFGKILSCEVIRDKKTGDSLQYAFVEFDDQKACEAAYFKMQGVLIDDHRIHVDFSQSVSRLSDMWRTSTNSKRRDHHAGKGGYGGSNQLKRKEHYRDAPRLRDDDMVFDSPAEPASHHRSSSGRDRSRDWNRDRYRERGRGRDYKRCDRSRSRSRDRERHRERDRDRDRDRDREKRRRSVSRSGERHRSSRDKDWNHDRERERERERDRHHGSSRR